MANARKPLEPALPPPFEPALALWAALASNLMQAQRLQFEAMAAWQRSLGTVGQEIWDEWAARFAGGVPIE